MLFHLFTQKQAFDLADLREFLTRQPRAFDLFGTFRLGIIFVIIGVGNMAVATSGSNPAAYKDARTQAMWAGISLGVLAALAVIVGAILSVFG